MIPVAVRFLEEGLGLLVVDVAGSNPASDMDVCALSVYVFSSQAEALLRADHLSRESGHVSLINGCVVENVWILHRRCSTGKCLYLTPTV